MKTAPVGDIDAKPGDSISRDIELREQWSIITRTERELTANLYGLIYDAISTDVEQRSQSREALTVPVSIRGDGCQMSGVTRDISTDGIGLVHAAPIECREFVVEFFDKNKKPTLLYVDIKWCRSIGMGWYASGGKFIYRLNSGSAVPLDGFASE